ncbi:MAG: hypothetical protein GX592_12005, partial [Clostridiales bacterium]|nr:hypothetical protein [Clostridiales bacterium]
LIAALPLYGLGETQPEFPFIEDPFEDRELDDFGVPESDTDLSIQIELEGKTHILSYDSSPEYSNVKDGMVQASFYEYDSPENTLYELYLVFPEDVGTDTTVDPKYAIDNSRECSVMMIVSDDDTETYYISGIMDGRAYPDGSDFSIHFEFVTGFGSGASYSGTLSATLIAKDINSGANVGSMRIDSAPFSFASDGASVPHGDDNRETPLPTSRPSDLRKA